MHLNEHKKLLVQAYLKDEDVNPHRELKCTKRDCYSLYVLQLILKIITISSWKYSMGEVLMGKAENNVQEDYPGSYRWQYCQKCVDKN